MANTSSRTLRLLSLLQARRFWPGAELAGRLEVSVRTLRRDVDRLRDLGYPVEASPGVAGGYALSAGAALPPLVIDDDEAVALAAAIQSRMVSGGSGDDAAVRALAKIVQVMPARLRRRLDAVRASTVGAAWPGSPTAEPEPQVLLALAQSCRDAERIRFDHRRGEDGWLSRHVEPFRMVALGRRWYLVGYDLDRDDWRTFRVDRISRVQATGRRFAQRRPPFDDVADHVRTSISSAGRSSVQAELLVDLPADRVVTLIGRWVQVEPLAADRCRVTMNAESLDWALFAAGTLGTRCEIVGPPELKDLAADWSRRLGAAAGGDREADDA